MNVPDMNGAREIKEKKENKPGCTGNEQQPGPGCLRCLGTGGWSGHRGKLDISLRLRELFDEPELTFDDTIFLTLERYIISRRRMPGNRCGLGLLL